MHNERRASVVVDLLSLDSSVTQITAQLADIADQLVLHSSSAYALAATRSQVQRLQRSVSTLSRGVSHLSETVDTEQQRHRGLPSPVSPPPEPSTSEQPQTNRLYNGAVRFGLAQGQRQFVPTIYSMLDDSPASRELGYCHTGIDASVLRTLDLAKMGHYTATALTGHQSAAVTLNPWRGSASSLTSLACTVSIATNPNGVPLSSFAFAQDMRAAELAASATDLDGHGLFCTTVERAAASGGEKPYLVIPTDCTPAWRREAGLPPAPFVHCGERLSRTAAEDIPGVHTCYEYVSAAAGSATGLHVEDAGLCSANVVLAGAPKVWLIVPPEQRLALEARVKEELVERGTVGRSCSQWVRHLDAMLSPRLLERWGVAYEIVVCRAGEMVVTLPGTYHQVVNAGPNYAQAINFALGEWEGPPRGYRFCGRRCPVAVPLTPAHFRIRKTKQRYDAVLGGDKERDDTEPDSSEEQNDQELDDDEEENNGKGSARDKDELSEKTSIDSATDSAISETDHIDVLPNYHATTTCSRIQALNHEEAADPSSHRKRPALACDSDTESDDWSSANTEQSSCTSMVLSRSVPESELGCWAGCVYRAAQGGSFNAEAVVHALHNAPQDQKPIKVLRTLQCMCEVANKSLLLQIRSRLLTDPAAAAALTITPTVTAPVALDDGGDIYLLTRLHQDISMLRSISWIAHYELAIQQLQYYEQFEAAVMKRKAEAKIATNERRNCRKRLKTRSASRDSSPQPLRPVKVEALIKEEIVSAMVQQGTGKRVAKDDLEYYLQRGKIFHLLLGPASPSLIPLFPLLDSGDKPVALDLLAYGPPDAVTEVVRKELKRPISSSCFFQLNLRLSSYFGEQLFVARPELEGFWHIDGTSTTASVACLADVSEERVALTAPAEVARLFNIQGLQQHSGFE